MKINVSQPVIFITKASIEYHSCSISFNVKWIRYMPHFREMIPIQYSESYTS